MNKLNLFIILSLCTLSLALYDSNSKVVKLTSANFREKVINSKELWFVEFYAPWCGHCQRLAPDWEKLARSLEGIIRVGAVDMDADKEAGAAYGIRGFPTIKFFGNDKANPQDYQGGRSANELVDYAIQQAKSVADARLRGKGGSSGSSGSHGGHGNAGGSCGGGGHQGGSQCGGGHQGGSGGGSSDDKDVVVLTDQNFDELVMGSEDLWIVEFYAPWCGHCKRLEPEWNEAATKLKGEVKIAKLDATVHHQAAARFGVSGYPTIKMFPPGAKSDSNTEPYEGSRDASSIAAWALEKKLLYKPAARVMQFVSQDEWESQCASKKGICLIAFLPHILDSSASERDTAIAILQEVAKSRRVDPVTYLWAQGGDYYSFEESLALGSGYPAVVAVSVSKQKFAPLRGSFTKKNVESFIAGLLSGRESLFNLPNVAPFKRVNAWDGEDAPKQDHDL